MSQHIKPCPFCGYRNPPEDKRHSINAYFITTDVGHNGTVIWAVVCPNCNAQGPLGGEDDAMKLWNFRGSIENV